MTEGLSSMNNAFYLIHRQTRGKRTLLIWEIKSIFIHIHVYHPFKTQGISCTKYSMWQWHNNTCFLFLMLHSLILQSIQSNCATFQCLFMYYYLSVKFNWNIISYHLCDFINLTLSALLSWCENETVYKVTVIWNGSLLVYNAPSIMLGLDY